MKINSEKLFEFVNTLGTDERVKFKVYYDDIFTGIEVFWDGKNFIWKSGKFCSGMFFDPLCSFEKIIEEKPKKIEEITKKTFSVESPTTKILSENILSYINYNCIDKINELIKATNYLLEKSDKDE